MLGSEPAKRDLTLYRKAGDPFYVPYDIAYEDGIYRPRYSVKYYPGTKLYKIVKFKQSDSSYRKIEPEEKSESEAHIKLANNLSRARTMIFQYSLSNPFKWFATLTLDKEKYDRYDITKFAKDLAQFIRDRRKEYDSNIIYLIIPEKHKDGAWHMHALFGGIPRWALSVFEPRNKTLRDLNKAGYMNWNDYAEKFGFVSMGPMKDKIATAFYVSKYVTKEIGGRADELGAHLYYCSRGLRKAEKCAEYYRDVPYLDTYCAHESKFCYLGYVQACSPERSSRQIIDDESFELPDRWPADIYEAPDAGWHELITDDETLEILDKHYRKMQSDKLLEEGRRSLGLDIIERFTYEQLSLPC